MSRFSVGQRVRIIASGPYRGTVCTVMSPLIPARNAKLRIVPDGELVHELDIDGPGDTAMIATPDCLEPINDGDQPASWSDCAWKPKHLSHTATDGMGETS